MGCDIPDIVWAIVYGVQEMCTAFQKGGRAGRRSDVAAKMVWLVEDWAFNKPADYQATSAKAKNEEERRTKMDPASREYINRSQSDWCMREFSTEHLCPRSTKLFSFLEYAGPEQEADEAP
jgi:hypothetical protein